MKKTLFLRVSFLALLAQSISWRLNSVSVGENQNGYGSWLWL